MDALEALCEDGLDAEERRALARPVAARTRAIHLAGDNDLVLVLCLVVHSGIVDARYLIALEVIGVAALPALGKGILELHVRERASHHHLMVAAPRTVGVPLVLGHAMLREIAGGRRAFGNRAGRRDVVGRHEVAQERQHACVLHRAHCLVLCILEVGRAAHIGRALVPGIGRRGRCRNGLPCVRAFEEALGRLLVEVSREHLCKHIADLFIGRQKVGEHDGLAVLAGTHRLLREIGVERADKRVGNDERRLCKIVLCDIGRDAAIEVPVARKDARELEIVCMLMKGRCNASGVADAAHAAKAAGEEAKLLEWRCEVRTLQDFERRMAARSHDLLDPGLGLKAEIRGFLRDKACCHHHGRIGCRRAARDGSDRKRAMVELARPVAELERHLPRLGLVAMLDRRLLEAGLEPRNCNAAMGA